mgnify:CR=1 FL=1
MADYVNTTDGTGLVHTAPGHGREDFDLWMEHRRELEELIVDTFDGLIARQLNATSEFGKEFDSLADMVSFGLAPAIVDRPGARDLVLTHGVLRFERVLFKGRDEKDSLFLRSGPVRVKYDMRDIFDRRRCGEQAGQRQPAAPQQAKH